MGGYFSHVSNMAGKIFFLCLLGIFGCTFAVKKRAIQTGKPAKVADVTWLTPEVQKYLATAKLEQLPDSVQRLVRAVGDNGHWCCAIDTNKVIVTSHAVLKYYHTSHHSKYYKGCGWWGWSRCSVHQVHYAANAAYFTNYKHTSYKINCPDHHAVCCQGYLLVAEHCLPLSQLGNIKDDLIKLKEMGQLGSVVG